MKIDENTLIGGLAGTAISFSGAVIDIGGVYMWVSIIIGIIGAMVTLITSIAIPFFKWVRKSKEDGKLSDDEIDELQRLLEDGSISLKEALERIKRS